MAYNSNNFYTTSKCCGSPKCCLFDSVRLGECLNSSRPFIRVNVSEGLKKVKQSNEEWESVLGAGFGNGWGLSEVGHLTWTCSTVVKIGLGDVGIYCGVTNGFRTADTLVPLCNSRERWLGHLNMFLFQSLSVGVLFLICVSLSV